MILFWIIAGLLTLVAAVVLAAPLFDTRKFKSEDAYALAVYRDQLAELSRDEQRGLLNAEQAKAAQVEISRRILALDEGKKFLPAKPPGHHLTLAMAVILPLAGGPDGVGSTKERVDGDFVPHPLGDGGLQVIGGELKPPAEDGVEGRLDGGDNFVAGASQQHSPYS